MLSSRLRLLSIVLVVFLARVVHMKEGEYFYDISLHRLVQAGEFTFGCKGGSVELKWKYRHTDHMKTEWKKYKGNMTVTVATFSDGKFTLDAGAKSVALDGDKKLSNNGCCGLTLQNVAMEDAGVYFIEITTSEPNRPTKSGNTTLHVYDDCPDVSNPTLKIECEVEGSTPKTGDFTIRDIVSVSVDIPSRATVLRRFYYQEQQHKFVQQPIRARCYNREDCDVVTWTLAKKSLSLAFYTRTPYLNMTLFARIYHKRALLDVKNLTFRLVDPNSAAVKDTTRCKNQEHQPIGIGWKPTSTWIVLLLTSLMSIAAAASPISTHPII